MSRPETGAMRFAGDWRGVFIRGDNAFGYAMSIKEMLSAQDSDMAKRIGHAALESLLELKEFVLTILKGEQMATPIERMIDANLTCGKCGTRGFMKCDCYEQCTCGWIADRGKPCANPKTARCSTKVKYGKYNRKTKRYE